MSKNKVKNNNQDNTKMPFVLKDDTITTLARQGIKPLDILVLLQIAMKCHIEGVESVEYPDKALSYDTGVTENTIRKVKQRLKESGLVDVVAGHTGIQGKGVQSTIYHINVAL